MFQVMWTLPAVDQLASRWTDADSALRHDIRATVHTVETWLRRDPLDVGESREGDQRIALVSPVGLRFHVDAANAVVWGT